MGRMSAQGEEGARGPHGSRPAVRWAGGAVVHPVRRTGESDWPRGRRTVQDAAGLGSAAAGHARSARGDHRRPARAQRPANAAAGRKERKGEESYRRARRRRGKRGGAKAAIASADGDATPREEGEELGGGKTPRRPSMPGRRRGTHPDARNGVSVGFRARRRERSCGEASGGGLARRTWRGAVERPSGAARRKHGRRRGGKGRGGSGRFYRLRGRTWREGLDSQWRGRREREWEIQNRIRPPWPGGRERAAWGGRAAAWRGRSGGGGAAVWRFAAWAAGGRGDH